MCTQLSLPTFKCARQSLLYTVNFKADESKDESKEISRAEQEFMSMPSPPPPPPNNCSSYGPAEKHHLHKRSWYATGYSEMLTLPAQ